MDVQQLTDARPLRWDWSRCSKGKERLHITIELTSKYALSPKTATNTTHCIALYC